MNVEQGSQPVEQDPTSYKSLFPALAMTCRKVPSAAADLHTFDKSTNKTLVFCPVNLGGGAMLLRCCFWDGDSDLFFCISSLEIDNPERSVGCLLHVCEMAYHGEMSLDS